MNIFRLTKKYFSKKIRDIIRFYHPKSTKSRPRYSGAVGLRNKAYGFHWRKV